MRAIPAAGTVPWRLAEGTLEVALVHRPRYDDWSFAKGKLDQGEEWPVAAVRETYEETGLKVHLGVALPDVRYTVLGRRGSPEDKVVRYWAAQVAGGSGALVNEIDEIAWLAPKEAYQRLDYARDRSLLLTMVRELEAGRLDSWPLLVVRHAKAVARSDYSGDDDRQRPLDGKGEKRSAAMVPILGAYGIRRLVSSASRRCVDTFVPYATASGVKLQRRDAFTEETFVVAPERASQRMTKLLDKPVPTAVCGHGPVLPTMLEVLRDRVEPLAHSAEQNRALLAAAVEDRMSKGEVLVCHLVGTGAEARVVSVERHLP